MIFVSLNSVTVIPAKFVFLILLLLELIFKMNCLIVKIFLFLKKGYNQLTNAIYNSIKNDIKLIKNCIVNKFKKYNNYYKVYTNKSSFKTKKLIFAIPKEALEKLCNSFNSDEVTFI